MKEGAHEGNLTHGGHPVGKSSLTKSGLPEGMGKRPGMPGARRHFDAAKQKFHPTMNENLREYYGKVQQHFKGGLPQKVQPPEYQ